jgi:hypothetical protein
LRAEIATIFGPNVVAISAALQKYTKFAKLQGYIFRILQRFATKLCNFTNFLVYYFREYTFFAKIKKLVFNGNCLLINLKLIGEKNQTSPSVTFIRSDLEYKCTT